MRPYLKHPDGSETLLIGNPVLDSLDGTERAPLQTILVLGEDRMGDFGVVLREDPPVAITSDMVDQERNRRIWSGLTHAGKRWQTRAADLENVAGGAILALAAIGAGAQPGDYFWHGGEQPFGWIAEDNSVGVFDAQGFFAFAQLVAAHKTKHVFAARELKNMAEIPEDYQDDKWWPTA